MKIKELLNQAQITPLIVHKDAPFTQLVSLLCKYNEIRDIFVVTDSNKFLGIIPYRNILRLVYNEYLPNLSRREVFELAVPCIAGDLMQNTFDCLTIEDNVEEIVPILLTDYLNEIPVVDSQKMLIGTITLPILLAIPALNPILKNASFKN
jgi:Mg/Co/Ni transporter MgtE